ncbi:MAG: hypothetical protein RLZZ210_1325 [Pseudomonadota bacterium]|jgi:hypothetical protein
MKTLHNRFSKEPSRLHIVYDYKNDKMLCIDQEKINYTDENLNIVFTLSSYLIGIMHSLKIPFSTCKSKIKKAIFKDLSSGKHFDRNSNLYNVLVYEFGIKLRNFNNFVSY